MRVILKADRLLDGTGGPPLDGASLVIEDGRVAGVHPGKLPSGLAQGAEVLDFPGCTIMPGMIDAHVHLNLPGDGTILEDVVREPEGVLLATSVFTAQRALAAGITTVRDLGGSGSTAIHLRRALELGYGVGPRVVACGQPITITGGHTWYFGGEADGVDALRRKVRHMVKIGADFIKVMGTGGGTLNTVSWKPSYSREEIAALADEAHRLGRRITVHCLCAEAIDYAIEAGVDQIEHASFLVDGHGNQRYDAAVGDRLARSGIPVTGTLAVGRAAVAAMRAKPDRAPADEAFLARWERMLEQNLMQFRRLREAGVRFVAGTDAGWRFTPFDGLPMEMELMCEGGLSAAEAIHAGTGFAAEVMGIAGKVGTLQPGLAADVIVVGGNPLDDLGVLRDVRLVFQAGVLRSRQGR